RIPVCSDANAVVAGDLVGAGDPDLVLGNAGPELVLLNDGTGRFVESVGAIPASPDVTQDVVLGDVDGDSDLDLVIANESEGPNLLLLNDGRGRFAAAPTPLPTRATTEATRNASLADMDGDGDLDLVFANVIFAGGDPQARLLRNAGGGRFEDVTSAQLPPGVQHCIDLEFADIDRDGDSDLLGTSFPAAAVGLYLNDGRGRFTRAPAAIFPEPVVVQGVEVEVGDVNGDGHRDLYVATFIESADVLLLNRR
ncbi:MAG: FG-GAP repeat domain-containing protein, partial [Gemmatimonadaceae bacterium]